MTDIMARLRSKSPYLHGSSAERAMAEAADEIEQLTKEAWETFEANGELAKLVMELRAEVERLHDQCVDHQRLSFEWMKKHDQLLAFIQARPELKELIAQRALEPKP